ncbi:MAG: sugar ABC transporter ATP-binding protein [Treponema sp.]|jgi:ribose transport system ATP-binding protein|nr:sugar ABC transporter ATP-binding protein [Treponema sp.]
MAELLLRMEGISKTFPGTKALDDVTLTLKAGEILALVGENGAGKSTLMNILGGTQKADGGKIIIKGREMGVYSSAGARDAGIGFVHQELFNCRHLTVAENVFMGRLDRYTTRFGFTDYPRINDETKKYLKMFASKIEPAQKIRELKIAGQQVVEIIKSISINCEILIFDEPTSSLTDTETAYLFEIIRHLKANGIGIIYISHRMEEVFALSDRIVVLRDGRLIDTLTTAESTPNTVVGKMVGRNISDFYPQKSSGIGENILEVEGLTVQGLCRDLNFTLRRGEILGLAGLVGAGRTEVICGLCGLIKSETKRVAINGQTVTIKNYSDAIKNGLVYLSEDRKLLGLFLKMMVKQNISATNLKSIRKQIFLNVGKESKIAENYVSKLNIKLHTVDQRVNALSGGNQQKIMVAKWLNTNPRVFILDEPTRGIDIGAKTEIHNMLRDLCNNDTGIIIISSELPEIIGMCDRVMVMHENKIMGEIEGGEINEEAIMKLATAV